MTPVDSKRMSDANLSDRKLEHIRIVLEEDVEPAPSPFQRYRLPYRALPELDLNEVSPATTLLGRRLSMPLLISSMTGGPEATARINEHLARAAQAEGAALALGSMRVCLREPATLASFRVRRFCPDIPLFANVGLIQLNNGVAIDDLAHLVDEIDADGIFLHLNALQEAIQPEGQTNFRGLVARLASVVAHLRVPVLAKEVGSGIDFQSAQLLVQAGVRMIDVAGTGGTSWSQVEGYRRDDRLGHLFRDVGVPTDRALIQARTLPGVALIAGGGVRSGLDMAKALILGATLAGAAKPFLRPALDSHEAVAEVIRGWRHELKVAMFACGAANLQALRSLSFEAPDQGGAQ